MKRIYYLFFVIVAINASAQLNHRYIYGISDLGNYTYGYLTRLDYATGEYDTLKNIGLVSLEEFTSCIDPYNGKYYVYGTIYGRRGNLHEIDLNDTSLATYSTLTAEKPEYNFLDHSLVFDQDSNFFSYNLDDHTLRQVAGTFVQTSTLYGKKRVYNPHDNTYLHISKISNIPQDPHCYVILDAFSGTVLSTWTVPYYQNAQLVHEGMVVDFETGRYFAHHNQIVFEFNPWDGTYQQLLTIPTYYYHANHQVATYDQVNKKYIVPFQTINYIPKIAVIDMVNYQIDTMYLQPDKWMDEHQIYCKPNSYLMLIGSKLYSSYGIYYDWFCNNYLIVSDSIQELIPFAQGDYQVMVQYPSYSSLSNIVPYYLVSSDPYNADGNIEAYPNPFSGKLFIRSDHSSGNCLKLHMVDSRGVNVYEELLDEGVSALDLSFLKPGIYFILYEFNSGRSGGFKVVKSAN